MIKGFRFKKDDRGISAITFPFMRKLIIPTTKLIFNPVITNKHNMPLTGPCFIYGNHSNYFDPFLLNVDMTVEPTAGVMTRDQFHKPIPRIFMDSIGVVPTSKYVPEPGIVRDVIKMIDKRRMIVIFPEGGRRWDGRPKPLIETTLKLFWRMKIPVHPVQLHGSHLGWPRWADKYRISTLEIRWLDPLIPSDYPDYDTFAEKCRSLIDFEEYTPPDTVKIHSCSKPASGIDRLLFRCPETGELDSIYTPDGKSVFSHTSTQSYNMDLYSRLIDKHGESHSVIEMFDKIDAMPIPADKGGVVLKNLGCKFYRIDSEHQLIKIGPGYTELTRDSIYMSYGSDKVTIPLSDIRYLSVEQNKKLSLTTDRDIYQIALKNDGALKWQTFIRRLQNGEKTVKSL